MQEIHFTVPYDAQGNGFVTIVGNYWQGSNPQGVILLHMMPATRTSWNTFAELLNQHGYHVLTFDLRGHGDSYKLINSSGEEQHLNYNNFHDIDHQNSTYDLEGAINFLGAQGISKDQIILCGASIGANLALSYMGTNHNIRKGIALSPGLDYRGIKTQCAIENMFLDQQILLVTAENDKYPNHSVNVLSGVGEVVKEIRYFETGGHGTDLFESHPELQSFIISWLKE